MSNGRTLHEELEFWEGHLSRIHSELEWHRTQGHNIEPFQEHADNVAQRIKRMRDAINVEVRRIMSGQKPSQRRKF